MRIADTVEIVAAMVLPAVSDTAIVEPAARTMVDPDTLSPVDSVMSTESAPELSIIA
jgi:hypothetical protein